jgi:hypothetical protein
VFDDERPIGVRRHERPVGSPPGKLSLQNLLWHQPWAHPELDGRPGYGLRARTDDEQLEFLAIPGRGFDGRGLRFVEGRAQMGHGDSSEQNEPAERPPARGCADRPLGIEQPADALDARRPCVEAEDAEGPGQAPAAKVGVPQRPQEGFAGLNRRSVALRRGQVVARVFPELINDTVGDPDRRVKEV